jgi:hypothetical protein
VRRAAPNAQNAAAAARRRALAQGHPGVQVSIVKASPGATGSVLVAKAATGATGAKVDDALDAFMGEMDEIGAFEED